MHKKTYRTQGEWAVYEVNRWMDRLERKRTLALDWNTEFWAAGGSRGNAPKQFIAGQSATQVQCAGLSSPSGEHIGPEEIRELIKKKDRKTIQNLLLQFLVLNPKAFKAGGLAPMLFMGGDFKLGQFTPGPFLAGGSH